MGRNVNEKKIKTRKRKKVERKNKERRWTDDADAFERAVNDREGEDAERE